MDTYIIMKPMHLKRLKLNELASNRVSFIGTHMTDA